MNSFNKDPNHYTPEMEEFYLGYEFELYVRGGWEKKVWGEFEWNHSELEQFKDDYMKLAHAIVRTPFLTKEQIEAEGWRHTGGKLISSAAQYFKKSVGEYIEDDDCTGFEYRMYYTASTHRMSIDALTISYGEARNSCYEGDCDTVFKGEIKSINEFRTLMKWIGIK